MKNLSVLSLLSAVIMLLGGVFLAPAQAQGPTNGLKPTFINPTPGLYVSGWPAFTVSYPKEWVELPPPPAVVFMAAGTLPNLPPSPVLSIRVWPNLFPLKDWAKLLIHFWEQEFTGIKVLSDKPSQLKDGSPAREAEVELVRKYDSSGRSVKNGPKINTFTLLTKRGEGTWVAITLTDDKRIGEDLKKIAYSLTFEPGREEPVKVPPDVRAFLDMWCADIVSHDVEAMMAHHSDRFLHSGANKAVMEQLWRTYPSSPIIRRTISSEITVTVFEPRGDKAYVDGFVLETDKVNAGALKWPMMFQQIINEHGQWKWYGNHR